MSAVAVIGRTAEVRAWASAGALVCPAETSEEMRRAFADLPTTVGLVLLTRESAAATAELAERSPAMTVVIP
jgi:hypothetical protein